LKALCRIAEFNEIITDIRYSGVNETKKQKYKYEMISTHTARCTFCSISIEGNMPLSVIIGVTGHKSIKELEKYIKVSDNTILEQLNRVFD